MLQVRMVLCAAATCVYTLRAMSSMQWSCSQTSRSSRLPDTDINFSSFTDLGFPVLQVRTASCGAANCVNTFGDEQLAVDLLADKLLFEALKYSVSF